MKTVKNLNPAKGVQIVTDVTEKDLKKHRIKFWAQVRPCPFCKPFKPDPKKEYYFIGDPLIVCKKHAKRSIAYTKKHFNALLKVEKEEELDPIVKKLWKEGLFELFRLAETLDPSIEEMTEKVRKHVYKIIGRK